MGACISYAGQHAGSQKLALRARLGALSPIRRSSRGVRCLLSPLRRPRRTAFASIRGVAGHADQQWLAVCTSRHVPTLGSLLMATLRQVNDEQRAST